MTRRAPTDGSGTPGRDQPQGTRSEVPTRRAQHKRTNQSTDLAASSGATGGMALDGIVKAIEAATGVPVFVERASSRPVPAADDSPVPPLERINPDPPTPAARRLVRRVRRLWNSYRLGHDLSYFRGLDAERNERLRLPVSEHLIYHCLWLTEFYTPSEAERMLRRLESIRASMKISGATDFTASVREFRSSPYGGGWQNIGYLVPTGARSRFMGPDIFETDLPKGVTHAPVSVMSLTPSLTALVVQFIFDDSVSDEYVSTLSRHHTTYAERKNGVIHFPGPKEHKRHEAAEARRRIRVRCAAWIKRTVPGYFAAAPGLDTYPALEFVTLRDRLPLDDHSLDDYMEVLDLCDSPYTWTVDGTFRLRRGNWTSRSERVAVLAAREDEVHKWTGWQGLGHGWTRTGVMVGLHGFSHFAAALAVDELICSFETELAKVRDQLSLPGLGRGDTNISRLERQLGGLSRATTTVCPELAQVVDESWFAGSLRELRWQSPAIPASAPAPGHSLLQSYRERADRLVSSELALRETLVAGAQIAAAREGLRLQRTARILAAVGVALAALGLVGWDTVRHGLDALIRTVFG